MGASSTTSSTYPKSIQFLHAAKGACERRRIQMGVQYGIWTFDRAGIATQELADVRAALASGESGRVFEYTETAMQMLYFPVHATSESESDEQPFRSRAGHVVTWDGRLDNREEIGRASC